MTVSNIGHKLGNTRLPRGDKELSGSRWAQRFLGGTQIRDLTGTFRYAVDDFVAAMTEAGIKVKIDATYRPIQRSYLMLGHGHVLVVASNRVGSRRERRAGSHPDLATHRYESATDRNWRSLWSEEIRRR